MLRNKNVSHDSNRFSVIPTFTDERRHKKKQYLSKVIELVSGRAAVRNQLKV